jgi:hypothetical protein
MAERLVASQEKLSSVGWKVRSPCSEHHVIKTYGERPIFLTWELHGGEWSISHLGRFLRPPPPLIVQGAILNVATKRKCPTPVRNRSPAIQLIASDFDDREHKQ